MKTNHLRLVLLICGLIAAIELFVSILEFSDNCKTKCPISSSSSGGMQQQRHFNQNVRANNVTKNDDSSSKIEGTTTTTTSPLSRFKQTVFGHNDEGGTKANIPSNNVAAEVISSTGVVFEGLKTRSFDGERIIHNKYHERRPSAPKPGLFMSDHECSNWGVVTTIFEPTYAIKRVADMPSWCLVVVADTKTPKDYMTLLNSMAMEHVGQNTSAGDRPVGSQPSSNVILFSVEMQKEWESVKGPLGSFVSRVPWKHFSRKNLGYLFAILHGAEFIFDFDDDNYIKIDEHSGKVMDILPDHGDGAPTGVMTLRNVSIVSIGSSIFNHHPIMGPSINETSWARGFPLDKILDTRTHGKVLFEKDVPLWSAREQVGVIQYLADTNPDIDAIHRLTKPLPMAFDFGENAQPVMVPKHAYAPYNAQATIHMKDAFWATLLPSTVPGRVSDIWRSYFAQCIFHDAGLRLVFAPPKIEQLRNDHSYLGDLKAEQDLYEKSGKLLEFLQNWDEQSANSVPERMEKLWIDLYEHDYIELEDVYAVQYWLGALQQIGYAFPPLKRRYRNVAVMGQFNYADHPNLIDNVIFWAQKHREYFHSVIAAGPFSDEQVIELAENSIEVIVSSLNGRKHGHYDPYENLMAALQLFKNSSTIEAVLYAHDDTLLNITELSQGMYPFPTNDIIGNTKLMERDEFSYGDPREAVMSNDYEIRYWANSTCYRMYPNGTVSSFDNTLSFDSFREFYAKVPSSKWNMYLQGYCSGAQMNLAKDPESAKFLENDGSMLFPSYTQADFLLVPTKYADLYMEAAKLHSKNNVFLECALPKIVDMVRQQATSEKVTMRVVKLCTTFYGKRGKPSMIQWCQSRTHNNDTTLQTFGVLHPIKLNKSGYKEMDWIMDAIQES
jgi:Protein of unknown function, DUF288.